MCTPGNSDILILSTVIGSLYLYDLKNIDNNANSTFNLNYMAMLEQLIPKFNDLDDEKK